MSEQRTGRVRLRVCTDRIRVLSRRVFYEIAMQNDGFLFLFFSSIIRDHMSNKMYYVTGPIVDIFHGTAFVAMRSILSKLVPANELGKLLL